MLSPPSRGAWIEIFLYLYANLVKRSPPSRGAWIEINFTPHVGDVVRSPPSRGAWIEILFGIWLERRLWVAPLAGGVD